MKRTVISKDAIILFAITLISGTCIDLYTHETGIPSKWLREGKEAYAASLALM